MLVKLIYGKFHGNGEQALVQSKLLEIENEITFF